MPDPQHADTRHYVRHFERHVACDFCGQQTRGRRDPGNGKVTCGSCGRTIVHVEPR